MTIFRKKPVDIEAEQFTEENADRAFNFIRCNCYPDRDESDAIIMRIQTLEGVMTAQLGDWIIKGVQGEFYPCKPDIFAATYEPVYTLYPQGHDDIGCCTKRDPTTGDSMEYDSLEMTNSLIKAKRRDSESRKDEEDKPVPSSGTRNEVDHDKLDCQDD